MKPLSAFDHDYDNDIDSPANLVWKGADNAMTRFSAVETQCLRPPYLRALCRYAKRFGVQSVVGMTGEWDQQTLFDYREWGFERRKWEYDFARRKRNAVAKASELVHGQGMKFFIWRHELSMHPEHIRKLNPALLNYVYGGGAKAGKWGESTVDVEFGFFDPRKEDLWKYVTWRFEHLFELFPDLDGIFLTCLTETKLPLWNLAGHLTKTEVLARLLDKAVSVCRRHGKQLIVRNWGAYRDPHHPQGHVLLDALDSLGAPDDVLIMEKSIEPDFALGYPPNRGLAASAKRRRTLVELELAGETEGGSTVPVCVPHEVQTAIRYALDCGCAGFVARVDSWADTIQWRKTHTTLGNQNEINLYSCLRLISDPEAPVDSLWLDWATERFGDATAPLIVELLQPTFDYALSLFTCRRNIMGDCEGLRPGRLLSNLTEYARFHYTGLPEDKRGLDAMQCPSEGDIRLLRREKLDAVAGYRRGVTQVEKLRGQLSARWYGILHDAFTHAAELAEFYALYTEALFRAVRYRRTHDARQKARVRALVRRAIEHLDTTALPNLKLALFPDRTTGTLATWKGAVSRIAETRA